MSLRGAKLIIVETWGGGGARLAQAGEGCNSVICLGGGARLAQAGEGCNSVICLGEGGGGGWATGILFGHSTLQPPVVRRLKVAY